jgi:tRNA nucleotidyltransferase (CCA-adding enzyme)
VRSIPKSLLAICSALYSKGFQAWLVGGAVRDSFMGLEPHDWDIATDATPDEVKGLFARVIPTGEKHGTVTVLTGSESYEVTTFRGDGKYSDGRRPDSIRFVKTIEEDLSRRDFTMNAIAYDPICGEWADPFGGRYDIERRVIRCVGDPARRFEEDGLRPLRACRFAATLGFAFDDTIPQAVRQTLGIFAKVAQERVRTEWMKIVGGLRPTRGLQHMLNCGLLETTAPEFLPMNGCTQNKYHGFDVWGHTLSVVASLPADDPLLRLAALFHDIGKPTTKGTNEKTGEVTFYGHEDVGAAMAEDILRRMTFSNDDVGRVCHLVRHHLIPYDSSWSKAAIRRWARKVGLEHAPSLLSLARADIAGKGPAEEPRDTSTIDELEERLGKLQVEEKIPTSTTQLAINGVDIMEHLGIDPGPAVGEHLKRLLELVTDDPTLNTREALLATLRPTD